MAVIHNTELKSPKMKLFYITIIFLLSVGLVIQFIPLFLMITGAFKTNAELMQIPPVWIPKTWNFKEIFDIFSMYNMTRNFLNTVILCGGVIIVQVTISALAAYSLSKLKPKFGNAVLLFFLATMMFSPQALMFPLYIMMTNVPFIHVNLINTKLAYILATAAWAYAIFLFKGFFDNTPTALIEAAKIDGASSIKIFTSILLPLSKPIF
ncbi:MAG: carbohydrate ABC transporter permease, partial [Oscillospiraceae bacterium]